MDEAIYEPDQFIEMNDAAMIDEYHKAIITDESEFTTIQAYLQA